MALVLDLCCKLETEEMGQNKAFITEKLEEKKEKSLGE